MRYNRIDPRFWTDRSVRGWSGDGQLLALYLLTCPHRTTEGLFRLPKAYIRADLEWSAERLAGPFGELAASGFLDYDGEAEVVLIRNALKYQPLQNDNQVTAALRNLEELPPTSLTSEFKRVAERFCERLAKRLPKGFGKPSPTSPSPAHALALTQAPAQAPADRPTGSPSASLQENPTAARTLALVDPAAETAQTVLGAYIDWRRAQGVNGIDRRTTGLLAKQLGQAFQAGHPPDVIKRGLVAWHERDQHPSTLASFIDVEARGGHARASPGKAQRQLDDIQRTYQQMQAMNPEGGERNGDLATVDRDRRQAQRELP